MAEVAICVCTRRRPEGIITLLKSINELDIPSGTNIKVIVTENDSEPYTKSVISDISTTADFKIEYYLETNPGISYARNRTVKEAGKVDYCCFVDDDQSVDKKWLTELLRCRDEFNSDGVWGPNPPVFSKDYPEYIKQFHTPEYYNYGTKVKQAYTNCLLIKKEWLDKFDGPFDLRLNYTGGEDSFLTANIINSGGTIVYTPYAKAYEVVPDERTTLRYFMKRTTRTINTKYIVLSFLDKNFSKTSILPRLILRFVYGIITSLPYLIFSKKNKYKGILKISDSAGGLLFVFGKKNKFYNLNKN